MIYRIEDGNINCKLNITPNINSQSYLRVNGLYKAYGTDYNFIDFYTNTSNNIFICIKENFADVYIDEKASSPFGTEDLIELNNFLLLKCTEIATEVPLDIDCKTKDNGKIYTLTNPIFNDRVSFVDIEISNNITDCTNVVKEVFPNLITDETYPVWYTNLSHRVRHGMSIAYTIKDVATATAYAFEEGVVVISYLGTIESSRNQGFAKLLLQHISIELNVKKFILQSQDIISDGFYEKLGFVQQGNYYIY